MQEWCGSVTQRVFPGQDKVRSVRLSYFENEGETRRQLDVDEGTLYEDALLIQLRELDGPFQGGEDWQGPLVRELWSLRTGHRAIQPVQARITRSDASPGGVPVTRFRLEAGEYWRTYDVEQAAPRRVLGVGDVNRREGRDTADRASSVLAPESAWGRTLSAVTGARSPMSHTPLGLGRNPKPRAYDSASLDYQEASERFWKFLSLRTVEQMDLPLGGRVLDVACGPGSIDGSSGRIRGARRAGS